MAYYGWVLIKFIIGFVIVITHLNLSGKTIADLGMLAESLSKIKQID